MEYVQLPIHPAGPGGQPDMRRQVMLLIKIDFIVTLAMHDIPSTIQGMTNTGTLISVAHLGALVCPWELDEVLSAIRLAKTAKPH